MWAANSSVYNAAAATYSSHIISSPLCPPFLSANVLLMQLMQSFLLHYSVSSIKDHDSFCMCKDLSMASATFVTPTYMGLNHMFSDDLKILLKLNFMLHDVQMQRYIKEVVRVWQFFFWVDDKPSMLHTHTHTHTHTV